MFVLLTSLGLTWSAGAGGATGSWSSSSWVGCLEQIMVSSVIQLKLRAKDSRCKYSHTATMTDAVVSGCFVFGMFVHLQISQKKIT